MILSTAEITNESSLLDDKTNNRSTEEPLKYPDRGQFKSNSAKVSQLKATCVAGFGYIVLTLLLTYPLIIRLTTHFPAHENSDLCIYLWDDWWTRLILTNRSLDLFNSNYMLYPFGVNFSVQGFLLNSFMVAVLYPIFGQIASVNITVFLTFIISGIGAFLLIDYVVKDRLAAFIGGAVFAFSPIRFAFLSVGYANLIHTEFIPFYILFFLRLWNGRKVMDALFCGVFLFLASISDPNYGLFLVLFSLVSLAYLAWRQPQRFWQVSLLSRLMLTVVVFALLFSPIAWQIYQAVDQGEFEDYPGWKGAESYVADATGFIMPSPANPVLGRYTKEVYAKYSGTTENHIVYYGLTVLLIAFYGLVRKRKGLGLWLSVFIIFTVLALGPTIHVLGRNWPPGDWFKLDGLPVSIPMPYVLFHYLPFLKEARCPSRFSLIALLALTVIFANGVKHIRQDVGNSSGRHQAMSLLAVTLVLVATITIDYLPGRQPTWSAKVPEFYNSLAADTQKYTVLEIPLGWRYGYAVWGEEETRLLYYQTIHGKKTLGGTLPRVPEWKPAYYFNIPVIKMIPYIERREQPYCSLLWGLVVENQPYSEEVARFLDLKYVIVHAPYIGTEIDSYVGSVFRTKVAYESDELKAFEIIYGPEPDMIKIDMGTDIARMYALKGWLHGQKDKDGKIFAKTSGKEAVVYFPKYKRAMSAMTLLARGHGTVLVKLNGQRVGSIKLSLNWSETELSLPKKDLQEDTNIISFMPAGKGSFLDLQKLELTSSTKGDQ